MVGGLAAAVLGGQFVRRGRARTQRDINEVQADFGTKLRHTIVGRNVGGVVSSAVTLFRMRRVHRTVCIGFADARFSCDSDESRLMLASGFG